ncbi:hypothetical protein Mapa_016362 [Marchantia paleacea]|nr:hypothetical protein Mapa_016362 [Marchantia paleacea]
MSAPDCHGLLRLSAVSFTAASTTISGSRLDGLCKYSVYFETAGGLQVFWKQHTTGARLILRPSTGEMLPFTAILVSLKCGNLWLHATRASFLSFFLPSLSLTASSICLKVSFRNEAISVHLLPCTNW